MGLLFALCEKTGECLITPTEILAGISYDIDFREKDIETTLKILQSDNYISYDHLYKNKDLIYSVKLESRGLTYERDRIKARKKIMQTIILTIVTAVIGVIIRFSLQAIFK